MKVYQDSMTTRRYPRSQAPDCLLSLGVLAPLPGEPDVVSPLPPSTAVDFALRPLERQIAAQREVVRNTKAAFSVLESVYAALRHDDQPGYTLLQGADIISAVLSTTVDNCRTELLTAQPDAARPPELLARALKSELPRLEAGISQRTLYPHKVRFEGATMDYVGEITGAGAKVRTTTEVFDRLIIVDREVAYIPVDEERMAAALEIRQPGIVRYLVQVFDHIWERSIVVRGQTAKNPPVATDVQRTILHGLVSGETDERIARRIGLSRRSVAEHVRRVSEQLGSSSRAQLGYLIAINGLLWQADERND